MAIRAIKAGLDLLAVLASRSRTHHSWSRACTTHFLGGIWGFPHAWGANMQNATNGRVSSTRPRPHAYTYIRSGTHTYIAIPIGAVAPKPARPVAEIASTFTDHTSRSTRHPVSSRSPQGRGRGRSMHPAPFLHLHTQYRSLHTAARRATSPAASHLQSPLDRYLILARHRTPSHLPYRRHSIARAAPQAQHHLTPCSAARGACRERRGAP